MPINELQERILVPVRGEPFEQAGIAEMVGRQVPNPPEVVAPNPLCRAEADPNARFSGFDDLRRLPHARPP